MAVHVPITIEARAEAWKLIFSQNNLLSPATGDPLFLPSQDMVLGCYYITTDSMKYQKGSGLYFSNINQVMRAFFLNNMNKKKIDLHAIIWVKWEGFFENGNDGEEPLEIRVNRFGSSHEIFLKYQCRFDPKGGKISQILRTTPGRIFFNLIIQKCLTK
jgi:DNA-directed RNA polymerase subunit beta'